MRPLALAALVLLLVPAAARAQACPASYASVYGNGFFYEESPTTPSWSGYGFAYNLAAGTVQAGVTGSGELGSGGQLSTRDRYAIVGPASATPIPFLVRMRFTGTAEGDLVSLPVGGPVCLTSQVSLRIASGSLLDESTIASDPCGPRPFDVTLAFALAKLPGEEFTLSTNVTLNAGHTLEATASGTLIFVDLPVGYSVQSCQGYAVAPVPVKATSWGAVKQLYR
jgi:hypothetical protein